MQTEDPGADKEGQTAGCFSESGRVTDQTEAGGNEMCVNELPYILCDECGGKIYKETDKYEQDDCYEIDGYRICGACVMKHIRKNHYVKLKEDAKC